MGRKYDAWQDAREASKLAEGRLSDCNGGSTASAMGEAVANRQETVIVERMTYDEWQEDPEG